MFIQFVIDVMLDVIWTGHPDLPVEIHMSGVNSLLIDVDSGSLGPHVFYRGARVLPTLHTDLEVILREQSTTPEWAYVGRLTDGALIWHARNAIGTERPPV